MHGCPQDRLGTAITTLAKMGAQIDITDEWITASAPSGLRPAAVHTDTHPGFMTDWQQPLMVLFTQAGACPCCTRRCSRTGWCTCPR